MRIIGRKNEQMKIQNALDSNKAEFVVVYGRRRVGKTYLIKEFFNDTFSFYTSGVLSRKMKDELYAFNYSLVSYGCKDRSLPKNWFEAFDKLKTMIEENIIKIDSRYNKRIIFIDELPWLDTLKSDFKGAFDFFWNTYASRQDNLVLIVCGSATSWIMNNLLNSNGGFHNRITSKIYLKPFNLLETEQLVNDINGNHLSKSDIINLYMIFGGVPYYLNFINPNFSLIQNVDNLLFKEGGELENEFVNLFSSLFSHYENHAKIIDALSKRKMGLTRKDILKYSNLSSGFSFTKVLQELEQCGFIRKYSDYKKENNESLYQLIDPFTLFSINFLKERKFSSWINFVGQPAYYSWEGYAFEVVCLNHIPQIKKVLGIEGIDSLDYSFSSNVLAGAQIDLLIDRKDNVINLCEMKYSSDIFTIDAKYEERLLNKIRVFKEVTKTKKAIVLTFVTLNGVTKNSHYGIVRKEISAKDFFI